LKELLLAFIPLFVAIDVLGTVPLFLSLTSESSLSIRKKLTKQAVMTALVIAVVIVFGGKSIFQFLGITIADFKIAGGTILLVLSVRELLSSVDHESKRPVDPENVGVVPLGIPLILGPAALTTLLILVDTHGLCFTLASLVINLVIVFVVFYNSHIIEKILGRNGAGAFGKVSSLFLAAIAVMMIRLGIMESGLLK